MSDLDDRSSGRRKGLFRRNRTEEFSTPAPWEPGDWDAPVEEEVLDLAPLPEAPRRRTTGDMFAQRERGWTDAWGDDAWDDEWRDPAFRRVSIPGAVTAQPADVDAWLDDDADNWSDITRETASRWGGMAPEITKSPAVQDNSSEGAAVTPMEDVVAQSPSPRVSPHVSPDVSPDVSLLDDPVERALATLQHRSIDLTDPDPEEVEELVNQSLQVPEARTTQPAGASSRGRFRRTRTVAPTRVGPVASPMSPTSAAAHDDSAFSDSAFSEPAFSDSMHGVPDDTDDTDYTDDTDDHVTSTYSTRTGGAATASDSDADDAWDDATGPLGGAAPLAEAASEADVVHIDDSDDADNADDELSNDVEPVEELAGSVARRTGRREAAFSDRATWIGAMVAVLAAIRLLFSVASGMRAADPAGSNFSFFTRIGRGFSELGVTQGALLVLAVVLISLPALVDPRASRRFDGRIASGLGITLGGATVGLLGALLAWSTQRHLASLAGSNTGSNSMQQLGELVATAGLCLVAFAGSLRALRSFHD